MLLGILFRRRCVFTVAYISGELVDALELPASTDGFGEAGLAALDRLISGIVHGPGDMNETHLLRMPTAFERICETHSCC